MARELVIVLSEDIVSDNDRIDLVGTNPLVLRKTAKCALSVRNVGARPRIDVLGRYQKSGAPHKMRKFYTSTTTIERDSESEGGDSRPPEMLL